MGQYGRLSGWPRRCQRRQVFVLPHCLSAPLPHEQTFIVESVMLNRRILPLLIAFAVAASSGDLSSRVEVYVEPFRRRGERVRVSAKGGGQPKWRGDGKELFYLAPDGALMSVTVREGSTGPEVGIPSVLVPSTALRAVVQAPDYDDYAVSSDGKRFLVKRPLDDSRGPRVHVVLDWPSLLLQ